MSVNPVEKKVLFTVLPFDLLVNVGSERQDRLTYTSLYGIDAWEKAVEEILDCRINYYARINYSKIASLIDAYGPIRINNPTQFQSYVDLRNEDGWYNPGLFFRDGEIELDGEKFLAYIKETTHLENGYETRLYNSSAAFAGIKDMFTSKMKELGDITNMFSIDLLKDYKKQFEPYKELVDNLEDSIASDIDAKKLVRFIIAEMINSKNKWSFEKQILTGEYDYYPCYSVNSHEMLAAIISNDALHNAKSRIYRILETDN